MIKRSVTYIILNLVICLFCELLGQQNRNKPDDGKPESVFNTKTPEHVFDIILCQPTNNSITFSLLFYESSDFYLIYYISGEEMIHSPVSHAKKDVPVQIIINNLKPDSKYYYHIKFKKSGTDSYLISQTYHFQTQRKQGENFIFTVTADSHLDQNSDTLIYKNTLLNIIGDSADFHIDLGDTWMTDKYRLNYKDAINQYLAQRYYFGLICHSSPLYFVLGNHDGEMGHRLNGKDDNMTVWSNTMRKMYFPNPEPDQFYWGNKNIELYVGLPQNYYAWEWGDALFIALDPFWFTPKSGINNPWDRTLGLDQYKWLKSILETSKKKIKFVFIHNLVGGADLKGKARGGAEIAQFFEWGGLNADSSNGFSIHRPGWELPIHQLLIKYGVTAVFHGHDHIFAKQELNRIIYQCLPQPGAKETGNTRNAGEYGYVNGIIKNGPGYMRVSISSKSILFEYVGTSSFNFTKNKVINYSYEIPVVISEP